MAQDQKDNSKKGEEISITGDFARAFDMIEGGHSNLLITGKAGTGKSTFLRYLREHTSKNCAVVAPTGVAALNAGGQTVHSFFQLKPRFVDASQVRPRRRNAKLYQKLQLLIIDEISMLRADILDGIDAFLRIMGPFPSMPFGGVQVCAIGDLMQLPPVVSRDEEDIFFQHYSSPMFYDARCFKEAGFKCVEFEEVFRQSDEHFIGLLNDIRDGTHRQETFDALNSRVLPPDAMQSGKALLQNPPGGQMLTLTPTNARATQINGSLLRALDAPEHSFTAKCSGSFDSDNAKSRFPAPSPLVLKEGAQVMLLRNDSDKRWVNGTLAVVEKLKAGRVYIRIKGDGDKEDVHEVERETWEQVQYGFDEGSGGIRDEVVGKFEQFPLTLAWAMTIHKSQGKTLDRVMIDLTGGVFAPGQVYVALSRARKLEDIILTRPIAAHDIKAMAHPEF